MSDISEIIRARCGVCGGEKDFIRVIEAHCATQPFANTPIGVPFPSRVATIVLPIAYCPDCKTVIYVGPSEEDVRAQFDQKRKQSELRGAGLKQQVLRTERR